MASVTDAEEALRATERKENCMRLTRLLMCGGVRILREKFDSFHSPSDLPSKLRDTATKNKLNGARLTSPEWKCLYPSRGTFGKSTDFDISLLFKLFRNICKLTEPITKWDKLPNITDHSLEADLSRVKYYRNSVHAHNSRMEIMESEFRHLWKEISEALLRIAGTMGDQAKRDEWKKAIDELLTAPLTPEAQRYVDELQSWYKKDMDLKDSVEQLVDTVEQLRQVNIDVRDQNQQLKQKLGKLNKYWITLN